MKILNCISPIPFYVTENERNHKNDYCFGVDYKNILLWDGEMLEIPAFVIHTDIQISTITQGLSGVGDMRLSIRRASDDLLYGTAAPPQSRYEVFDDNGFLTILFKGYNLAVPWPLGSNFAFTEGKYWFRLDFVLNGYAEQIKLPSEYWYATKDIHNYVKLQWTTGDDLRVSNRIIPFTHGFEPFCYVDALIGKPSYTYEEEATDRFGYEFIESQISKKTFTFGFAAPEYLCDVLRVMKLCAYKTITRYDFPHFGESYSPMNMMFDVDWLDGGDLAGVTISFSIDNIIANIGGYEPLEHGDFNNDYDNDFFNK